jgi:hypothetical protein
LGEENIQNAAHVPQVGGNAVGLWIRLPVQAIICDTGKHSPQPSQIVVEVVDHYLVASQLTVRVEQIIRVHRNSLENGTRINTDSL